MNEEIYETESVVNNIKGTIRYQPSNIKKL